MQTKKSLKRSAFAKIRKIYLKGTIIRREIFKIHHLFGMARKEVPMLAALIIKMAAEIC